jgi:hypothetical protein
MQRKQGLFHKRSYKESQNVVVKESHKVSVKITSVGSLSDELKNPFFQVIT